MILIEIGGIIWSNQGLTLQLTLDRDSHNIKPTQYKQGDL